MGAFCSHVFSKCHGIRVTPAAIVDAGTTVVDAVATVEVAAKVAGDVNSLDVPQAVTDGQVLVDDGKRVVQDGEKVVTDITDVKSS